jgi:hypothetical protein
MIFFAWKQKELTLVHTCAFNKKLGIQSLSEM